ncbi:MAG: type I-U CRISPR-associated protein Csb2, partial [Myxococcota bacterium]|nr:type I-U CRISPR-associated protein Csb2 [Myxococcota bacterium]
WGHHVNEGLVEWPPSPWRIVRALIACGYATQGWREVPPAARRLVETLAGTLPRYRLPPASLAHSRHYMPLGAIEKGREKTTLVFDTWADVGDGAVAVRWNCPLDGEAASLLGRLARQLGYLGRSESWVLAEVVADDAPMPDGTDAYPHSNGRPQDPGWEQVPLIAPEPADEYARRREDSLGKVLEALPLPEGRKKPSKTLVAKRAKAEEPYPRDLVACLEQDTAWWKRHGWSQPPGSRRVLYWRRTDALAVGSPPPRLRAEPARVTTMLLALTTPTGTASALPRRTRTLAQAELLHRALVARVGHGAPVPCPELTGKDERGRPLIGHRHAHILPVDLDGDGHLDHVVVHAPMGLGGRAQHAIRGLRRTWTKGGVGELQLAVAGLGDLDDLRRLPPPLEAAARAILGPPGGGRTWVSASPFVLPRHLKPRGKDTIEGQVQAELASRGLPRAIVEVLPWDEGSRELRHAVRVRRHPAKPPPADAGLVLRLVMDRPAQGPITLGYGAHFGLGLFVAVE